MVASQDEKRKGLEHAMSNQEAADILKKLVYIREGRGNGKSHTMMKVRVALIKAIRALEQDSQH